MSTYRAGVVIPIYLTRFIAATVECIKNTTNKDEAVFCIVNDGVEEVKNYLETLTFPDNVYVLNLPENRCFAGSNNAGFKSLMEKYPELEYLGSINDDTLQKPGWLSAMIKTLDNHPEVALTVPQLIAEDINGNEFYTCAIFTYGPGCQMLCDIHQVFEDSYTNLIGGCCFLCRKAPFIEVDFLDEGYKNGAEDVDLSLKFITQGYKMMVCADAGIMHFGGCSRSTRPNIGIEISQSIDLLHNKWGYDLTKYNSYQFSICQRVFNYILPSNKLRKYNSYQLLGVKIKGDYFSPQFILQLKNYLCSLTDTLTNIC